MAIRLLALDLDGTLVNDRLKIDPRDAVAVRAAEAAGVRVVIATGRMFRSSVDYARQLGLRGPIVNYQGAVINDIESKEVLYRCELDLAMQRRVLEYAEPRGWHVNAYVDEVVYTAEARPEADLYARIAMAPYEVVGPLSRWISRDSTKMVLVGLHPEEVPQRMAELSRWMEGVARVTTSLRWFVEVINPNVSKARALAMVADRLGVQQAEVCAVGDNRNDLEMITWAGFGVAMGTAPPDVRQAADFVTTGPDDAGVANVVRRFILEGEPLPAIRPSG